MRVEGAPAEDEDEGERHGDDGGVGFGAAVGGGDQCCRCADEDTEVWADDGAPEGGDDAGGEGEGNNGPGFEGFPAGQVDEVGVAAA